MSFEAIAHLPVQSLALPNSHLYLWSPNALVPEALTIMQAWGFTYKTNLVWYKIRQDGGPDGRGVGCYFRNVTAPLRGEGPAQNPATRSPASEPRAQPQQGTRANRRPCMS
jgi:N6-adenosine-specific RNA methylase IME4